MPVMWEVKSIWQSSLLVEWRPHLFFYSSCKMYWVSLMKNLLKKLVHSIISIKCVRVALNTYHVRLFFCKSHASRLNHIYSEVGTSDFSGFIPTKSL